MLMYLTVHGRTKEQNKMTVGSANWELIGRIKDTVLTLYYHLLRDCYNRDCSLFTKRILGFYIRQGLTRSFRVPD